MLQEERETRSIIYNGATFTGRVAPLHGGTGTAGCGVVRPYKVGEAVLVRFGLARHG